jgi:peptidyl-tRNA hydrolase
MQNNQPKQILVWRNDVRNINGHKVRAGKQAAQLAHASLGAILNYSTRMYEGNLVINVENPAVKEWLEGRFTKIAVVADNLEH